MKQTICILALLFVFSGCTTITSVSSPDSKGYVYVVAHHTKLFIFTKNVTYRCKEEDYALRGKDGKMLSCKDRVKIHID